VQPVGLSAYSASTPATSRGHALRTKLIHPDEAARTLEFILGERSGMRHEMDAPPCRRTWLATGDLRDEILTHDREPVSRAFVP
jgi:hypothetical protein